MSFLGALGLFLPPWRSGEPVILNTVSSASVLCKYRGLPADRLGLSLGSGPAVIARL